MKKYKLIQEYPGSPKLGTIIEKAVGFFIDGLYTNKKGFFLELPEKYPNFWEEFIEVEFKILSFELNNLIFKLGSDGKYYSDNGTWANFVNTLNDKILSVERTTDGQIFNVNDKAKSIGSRNRHRISSFEIKQKQTDRFTYDGIDRIWVNWEENCGGNWLESTEKIKEPIGVTRDGVELYFGDTFYVPQFKGKNWSDEILGFKAGDGDFEYDMNFIFSNRYNAQEFLMKYKNYSTIDGGAISPNDEFYVYDDVNYKWLTGKHGEFFKDKYNGKRYKDKEIIERLIAEQKPQYSVNDIHRIVNKWSISNISKSEILNFIKNDKQK